MKNEFNFQSVNPVTTAAKAALWAAPALLLTVHQYGWSGLATLSALIGGASAVLLAADRYLRHRNAPLPIDPEQNFLNVRDATLWPQQTALDLAAALDMKDVPVIVTARKRFAAGTMKDRHGIAMNYHFLQFLDHDAMRFTLAHELDHIRHPGDEIKYKTANVALALTALWAGKAAAAHISGFHAISQYDSLIPMIGNYVGTSLSLLMARRSLGRDYEFRADSNALRMTGSLQGGLKTVLSFDVMGDYLADKDARENGRAVRPPQIPGGTLPDRLLQKLLQPLAVHPDTDERVENLNNTFRTMQREAGLKPTI